MDQLAEGEEERDGDDDQGDGDHELEHVDPVPEPGAGVADEVGGVHAEHAGEEREWKLARCE